MTLDSGLRRNDVQGIMLCPSISLNTDSLRPSCWHRFYAASPSAVRSVQGMIDGRYVWLDGSEVARLSLGYQALPKRIYRRLGAVGQMQLAKDITDVGFYRFLTDHQFLADFPVVVPLSDQL